MVELTPFWGIVISITATLSMIVAANIWNSKSRRDRREADKREVGIEVDKLTDEQKRDDAPLAELERTHIYYKIDALAAKVLQDKINLGEQLKTYTDRAEQLTKNIEFLQTMAWGPDAKSIPRYMLGEEETKEHKREPGKGVFRDRTKDEQDEIDRQKEIDVKTKSRLEHSP